MATLQDTRRWLGDSFSPFIAAGGQPVVPTASLTLDPFATTAYVLDGTSWHGVDQPSAALGPLNAGDGTYWVVIHRETGSVVSGWTRQAGTHYAWQINPAQPATPAGGLLFAQVTVAGGAITGVSLLARRKSVTQGAVLDGVLDVREVGARMDGTTDDTAAVQRALDQATVVIISGGTCLVNSANLTLNTGNHLRILAGATLHLDGRRIEAYNVNHVRIDGGGKIQSSNYNTTDPVDPTGATLPYARGIIEFGSTTTTVAIGVTLRDLEIFADWTGTPGADPLDDYDKGIMVTHADSVYILNNIIHNIKGEAILTNQGQGTIATNLGWWIQRNRIYQCNHDAISTQTRLTPNTNISYNFINACRVGVEGLTGLIQGNQIDSVTVSGFFGGGNFFNDLELIDNVVRNAGNIAYDLQATIRDGYLRLVNNVAYNAAGTSFFINDVDDLIMHGNVAIGTAQTIAGSNSFLLRNIARGAFFGNVAVAPHPTNAANALNIDALIANQDLYIGENFFHPHTTATHDMSMATQVFPTPQSVIGNFSAVNHTGTLVATLIREFLMPVAFLRENGIIQVQAAGKVSGTAGTKLIELRLGGTVLASVSLAAGETDDWAFDGVIANVLNQDLQRTFIRAYKSSAAAVSSIDATQTSSGTLSLALFVTLGNTADTVTAAFWSVAPQQGWIR